MDSQSVLNFINLFAIFRQAGMFSLFKLGPVKNITRPDREC